VNIWKFQEQARRKGSNKIHSD